MAVELSNMSMPMAALLASLIGASATITAAILNLRMAWKRELLARAQHKPVTKKSSRAPVVPLMVLLLASAAGGFALSYHLGNKNRANIAALEADLRTKIEQLNLSTQRLETVSLNGAVAIAQQVRDEERRKRGAEGVTATIVLDRCTSASVEGPAACDENTALTARVCTEIPADANVVAVDLYARPEGDVRPWNETRVFAGRDFGGGRFTDRTTESLVSETAKQVCRELVHWNSGAALQGRIVVHYDSFPVTADQAMDRAMIENAAPPPHAPAAPSLNRALSQVP